MITTGIIRKIDELGRIVIPKEIRKNLNIKNNDDLEIFIEQEKIILKKYHKLYSMENEIKKYIDIIKEYTSFNILFTDLDKVIASSNKEYEEKVGINISQNLLSVINERKKIIVNDINPLIIVKGFNINTKYCVIPLVVDANLIGSIIVISSEEIVNEQLLPIYIIVSMIKNNCFC